MPSPWFTKVQHRQLLANGRKSVAGKAIDPPPVVKLALFDAGAAWLLISLDPDDPTKGYGLIDLGQGSPALGVIDLKRLKRLRGFLKLPVYRDVFFQPDRPLSAYAAEAIAAGRITV